MNTPRHLLLAIGLCLCLPSTGRAQPAPLPASQTVVERAKILSFHWEFDDAQRLLDARIAQKPPQQELILLQHALADLHYTRGFILDETEQSRQSLFHFQAAREIDAKWRPERVKLDLRLLGRAYLHLGQYENGAKFCRLAAAAYHQSKNPKVEVEILGQLVSAYKELGRTSETLSTYEEILRLCRPEQMSTSEQLRTLWKLKSPEQIKLPVHQKAWDEFRRQKQKATWAEFTLWEAFRIRQVFTTLQAVRDINTQLGHYKKALDAGTSACTQASEFGYYPIGALVGLALTYQKMHNRDKAIIHLNKALCYARNRQHRYEEADVLENIGSCLSGSQKAIPYFQKSLALYKQQINVDGQIRVLNDLGVCYSDLGQPKKGLDYLNQTLALARKHNINWGQSIVLNGFASVYAKSNRYDEAIANLNVILKANRAANNREEEAYTLDSLSRLAARQNRLDQAILYGKQVVNIYQALRVQNQNLEGSLRRSYLSSIRDRYELLVTWLVKKNRLEEAEQVLRFLRQEDAFEFVKRDPQLTRELADLFHPLVYTPAEKKQLDAEGVKIAASQVGQGSEESRLWQQELQKQEDAGRGRAALLSTFNTPDAFILILTTAKSRRAFTIPIKRKEFDELSTRLQRALSNRYLDPRPDALMMYKVVFADGQLEKALHEAGIKTALWFTSGSLRYIPIDALYDGTQYLLKKEWTNVYVTLKSRNLFDATTQGDALAVGVSQGHNLKDEAKGQKGLIFEPLPNVPKEVRSIVSDPGDGGTGPFPGTILLDQKATIANLEHDLANGISILHIATHFVLVSKDESGSFFLMGDGTRLPLSKWKEALKLKGVGLLTLSACETGVGTSDATGIEVSSIGELSQYLGAQSVVVSLWPVADNSTAALMRNFYTRLHNAPNLGKAEALREAQRALLGDGTTDTPAILTAEELTAAERGRPVQEDEDGKQVTSTFIPDPAHPYAHPFYWAPFSLIGNWK